MSRPSPTPTFFDTIRWRASCLKNCELAGKMIREAKAGAWVDVVLDDDLPSRTSSDASTPASLM